MMRFKTIATVAAVLSVSAALYAQSDVPPPVAPAAQPEAVAPPAPPAETPVAETAPAPEPVAVPAAPAPVAPAPAAAAPEPAAPPAAAPASEEKAAPAADAAKDADEKDKAPARGVGKITGGLNAGSVTVDGNQWTRIALFADIPIWRFGVGLDLELFLDEKGSPSSKGWEFTKDTWAKSLLRKVRYVRFNHEDDKVFVKVGGLEGVTLGQGFVMNNFTNMLNYPDQKLLGAQFYLNDISPIGISLQTVCADFYDIKNDGGVFAGRLGVRPLKALEKPIISGITIGGTIGYDRNQYSGVRDWAPAGSRNDLDADSIYNLRYYGKLQPSSIADLISNGLLDTSEFVDTTYRDSVNSFMVVGGDLNIPLIAGKLVKLDLYGQAGITFDDKDGNQAHGWGIGAPGIGLKVGPFWSRLEYRHVKGQFEPGYFNEYYLSQRLVRGTPSQPYPTIKEDLLADEDLNGIFGDLGCNIAGIFILSGTYQRLVGDTALDQRFNAKAGIGEKLISKIPVIKIHKLEAYFDKERIDDDSFFEMTPIYTHWGFRVGIEAVPKTLITWEARYGKKLDESGNKVDDNSISIQAGIVF